MERDALDYIEAAENVLKALKIGLIEAESPEGDEEILVAFDELLDNWRSDVERDGPLVWRYKARGVEISFIVGLHYPELDIASE